jgi:hypothetical protein
MARKCSGAVHVGLAGRLVRLAAGMGGSSTSTAFGVLPGFQRR